jgi:hypothetical protein
MMETPKNSADLVKSDQYFESNQSKDPAKVVWSGLFLLCVCQLLDSITAKQQALYTESQ